MGYLAVMLTGLTHNGQSENVRTGKSRWPACNDEARRPSFNGHHDDPVRIALEGLELLPDQPLIPYCEKPDGIPAPLDPDLPQIQNPVINPGSPPNFIGKNHVAME